MRAGLVSFSSFTQFSCVPASPPPSRRSTVELQNALDVLTMGSMLWDLRTAKPVLGVVNRICETVALLDPNFASKMRRGAIVQAMVAERMQVGVALS